MVTIYQLVFTEVLKLVKENWLKIKQIQENIILEFFWKVFFGFAELHDFWTYSLRYKLILKRASDNHVISHPAGANGATNLALAGRVIIEDISLYVL